VFQFLLACNRDVGRPCRNGYAFEATAALSPQQETYGVGDTLFLNSSIPKRLRELNGSGEIDYSGSTGVAGNLFFQRLDSVSQTESWARYDFSLLPQIGRASELDFMPEKGINVHYLERETYQLQFAIILNRPGVFAIGVSDLGSRALGNRNCTNAAFTMTITNTNKNLSVYERVLGRPPGLAARNIYCFRVVP